MTKITKKYNRDYTVIQNSIFKINDKLPKNEKMGFKEVGIFWYLWHLPDDWEFHETEIINHFKGKIDSFRSGRKKLEKYGFISKTRQRNTKGQLGAYKWILNDDPNPSLDFPSLDKPIQGKPIQEKPTLQSINQQSTKELSINDDDANGQQSKNNDEKTIIRYYFNAFDKKKPNDYVLKDINNLRNVIDDELIIEAIKRAADRDKGWIYARKIIENWINSGATTLKEVIKLDYEHSNKSKFNKHVPYNRKHSDRKVPEWMKEKYDPEKDKTTPEEQAEAKAALERIRRMTIVNNS